MSATAEHAVRVLTPYIGATLSDTYMRGTALSVGKMFDTLSTEDLPAIEERARGMLSPLLPASSLERVLAEIRGGVL